MLSQYFSDASNPLARDSTARRSRRTGLLRRLVGFVVFAMFSLRCPSMLARVCYGARAANNGQLTPLFGLM